MAEAGDVEEGVGVAETAGEEAWLDIGGCQGVEDIETPCEDVESDGEVDDGWVQRGTDLSVSVLLDAIWIVCVVILLTRC